MKVLSVEKPELLKVVPLKPAVGHAGVMHVLCPLFRVVPLKPGGGPNIAMHVLPTASVVVFHSNVYLSGPFSFLCSKSSVHFSFVFGGANAGSDMGRWN